MKIKENIKFEFKLFGFTFRLLKEVKIYTREEYQEAIFKGYEKLIMRALNPLPKVEERIFLTKKEL